MVLSDRGMRQAILNKLITIEPLKDHQIQPASIDVHLGSEFISFVGEGVLDPRQDNSCHHFLETPEEGAFYLLPPGGFVLGTTLEKVTIGNQHVCRVEGKSSLGRLGLLVHVTAGFIDPGFSGQVTLEFSNVAPLPIKLWPGMKIAQLSFVKLDQPAERPYGHPELNSKYQGQVGTTPSQYHRNH
jgi:dCTP deaminase